MGNFIIHLLTSFCLYGSEEAKGCGCLVLFALVFIGSFVDAVSGSSTSGASACIVFSFLLVGGIAFIQASSKSKETVSSYKPIKEKNILNLRELNRGHFSLYKENKIMDGNLKDNALCADHICEFIIAFAYWETNEEGIPVVYLSTLYNDMTFYLEYEKFDEFIDLAGEDSCIPAIIHFKDHDHGRYRIMKADSWKGYEAMMGQFSITVGGIYK